MKRWMVGGASVVFLALFGMGVRGFLTHRAFEKRQAGYQAALRNYSEEFRPGLTRKVIEDTLKQRNVLFSQRFSSHGAGADLIGMWQEKSPVWYCSELDVWVQFEFRPVWGRRHIDFDDSDVLTGVSLDEQLDGCL